MNTFLSIDLDFWANKDDWSSFFKKLANKKLKGTIVWNHHEMVKIINKYTYDKVINVDFHSDLDNCKGNTLTEGNWANWLKKEIREGRFIWMHPNKRAAFYNYCHYVEAPNPFKAPQVAGWKKTQSKYGLPNDKDLNEIKGLCFCISHKWISKNKIQEMLSELKEKKIISGKQFKNYWQRINKEKYWPCNCPENTAYV